MVSHKSISKETRNKPTSYKLKDKTRNTTIRQRTRVTDIVQYVTNTKWKWDGYIA